MRTGAFLTRLLAVLGLAAALASPAAAETMESGAGVAPKGPLNTLKDVGNAIGGCWRWPPANEVQYGMELTVMLSFRRDGTIFGARINYARRDIPAEEKALYYAALLDAMRLCSPLPLSPSLGEAIAGRPFVFTFRDTRKERKA
jgi:hypothetical protein